MTNQACTVIDAFRILRSEWFYHHIEFNINDREFDDKNEKRIEADNAVMKYIFDLQTEDIIVGIDRNIAPLCFNEIIGDDK